MCTMATQYVRVSVNRKPPVRKTHMTHIAYIATTIGNLAQSIDVATTLVVGKHSSIYPHRKTTTITPESIYHTDPFLEHTTITVTAPLDSHDASDNACFHVNPSYIESGLEHLSRETSGSARDIPIMVQGVDSYMELATLNSDRHSQIISGWCQPTPVTVDDTVVHPVYKTTAGELGRIWHRTRHTFNFTYGNDVNQPDGTRHHVNVVDGDLMFAANSGNTTSITTFRGDYDSSVFPTAGLAIPSQLCRVADRLGDDVVVELCAGVDPDTGIMSRFILRADNGVTVVARLNDNPIPLDVAALYREAVVSGDTDSPTTTRFTVPTEALLAALDDTVGRARRGKGVTVYGDSGSGELCMDVFTIDLPRQHVASGSMRGVTFDSVGSSSTFDCPSLSKALKQISSTMVQVTLRGPGNVATFEEVGGDSVFGVRDVSV